MLMSLDAAIATIAERVPAIDDVVSVDLWSAAGHVLAQDGVAVQAVPGFDNSAMDGWAVCHADWQAATAKIFPIAGRIAAGHPLTQALKSGHAYRIFTGAPLPPGLDAVAKQEVCSHTDKTVTFPDALRLGENIRPMGEAVALGHTILRAGTRLQAAHLGLAASAGLSQLMVRRPLRIAVFSTGDELVQPGAALGPGQIYDANRLMLVTLLRQMGCQVQDLGVLPDHLPAIIQALQQSALQADLILTSGGVSVGEEDHIKAALAAIGQLDWWRLAIKPGKPLALGRIGKAWFLGLPGNPVSLMVTFLLVGRAVLAALNGSPYRLPRPVWVPAAFGLDKAAGCREFPRARLDQQGRAILFPSDSSSILRSLTESDGLLDLAEDLTRIEPGDNVALLPMSELMA